MSNVVKRFCGQTVEDVPLIAATALMNPTSCAMALQPTIFNGVGYDCTLPGVYRFWSGSGTPIHSRIGWGGTLMEKMSALSWHHHHGIADEALTGQILANAGMTHKWRLRCGYICDLVLWFKNAAGFFSNAIRKVQLLTLGPLNGVDDGHIVVEIQDSAAWKLFDVTNGCYFTLNGVHLSAAEIIAMGVLNCVREPLDADEKTPADYASGWCFSSYRDIQLRTSAEKDAWFTRIYQSWSVL